jgi:hypothetical protein
MTNPIITASYSLLGRIIGDLMKGASQSVATQLEILNTPEKIKSLSKKLALYEFVKTIKSPDKSSRISSFFVPPCFMDSENTMFEASRVKDFGENEHCLIEGIAGQGKSIFMRHLLIEEIKLGQRLPILIELRKLTPEKDVREIAMQFMKALGFRSHEEIFNYLLDTGFAVLLLDGYDETPEECRMKLLDDLSMFALKYENLQIVVSSRPEASIGSVSWLKKIRICRLDKPKRDAIVRKICERVTADSLIAKLNKNTSLSELVDTPLFATLLSVVYRAELRLPETVHEFYDLVFATLLYRHDDHKEGFERPRKSGLGNHMFKSVFENFCFRTSLNGQLRLSQEAATQIFSESLKKEGADPLLSDNFFTDITKITCLLVRDGTEFQFLHKSIQEYFSAGYIKRLPEDTAKEFYQKILRSPQRISQLSQSIRFLCEVDSYRAYRFFMLPGLSLAIFNDDKRWNEIPLYKWPTPLIMDIAEACNARIFLGSSVKNRNFDDLAYTMSGYLVTTRYLLLEEFALNKLVISAYINLVKDMINKKLEKLSELLADEMIIAYDDPINPKLITSIQVEISRPLGLIIQDNLEGVVNGAGEMNKFRAKVSDMLALLELKRDSDLLDQI